MNDYVTLQVPIDNETKEAVEKLYQSFGTNFSEVVKILAEKSLELKNIPFSINREKKVKFFGALSKYANPKLMALEKNALEEGIAEDYEKQNFN